MVSPAAEQAASDPLPSAPAAKAPRAVARTPFDDFRYAPDPSEEGELPMAPGGPPPVGSVMMVPLPPKDGKTRRAN